MPAWKKMLLHGSSGSLAHLKLENLTSQNVLGTDSLGNVVAGSVSGYSLPTATSLVLGGIKVGGTLAISSGILNTRTYIGASGAGVGDVEGGTGASAGVAGYVPAASSAQYLSFLRGDGTWQTPTNTVTRLRQSAGTLVAGDFTFAGSGATTVSYSGGTFTISSTDTDTNTTYSVGDGGLSEKNFTATLKTKLDGIATSADNYSSWTISDSTRSEAIRSGDTLTIRGSGATSVTYDIATNIMVVSSTDTDTNTTYTAGTGLTLTGTAFSVTTNTYAAAAHSHAIGDITDLQTALDGKQVAGSYAASSHTHDDRYLKLTETSSFFDRIIDSAPGTLDTLNELAAAIGDDANFSASIAGVLARKADSSHTHAISAITDLQTALDGKQASGNYSVSGHTHTISNVTDLQTSLDGKQASLGFTPYNATNPSGYITSYVNTVTSVGIVDDLSTGDIVLKGSGATTVTKSGGTITITSTDTDTNTTYSAGTGLTLTGTAFSVTAGTYAAASHTHTIGNVTGLQTALDGKQASGNYSVSGHTHDIRDITDLQTTLDGKLSTTGTAAAATVVATLQDSAPAGTAGKLWWETDTGILKVYYGSAWVDAVPMPDMSLYYSKAGGAITGDVSIQQTLTVAGNITVDGKVDGRDIAADGLKLDGIATEANNYSLPTATASVLGGIKVGTNLSISSGVLSSTDTDTVTSVGISGDLSTGNIDFRGSGATTISKTGGTITITSTDTDTNTTYSAGTNLSLSGTTFNVSSTPSFTRVAATEQVSVNNRSAMSVAHWSNSGSPSTGAVIITLPGTHTGNWSMLVLRITAYEYSGNSHCVYYVSGHDWTSGWYNNGVTKIGIGKDVRLGYNTSINKDVVVLGETNSTWSYGHVTVDVIAHPSFYTTSMDITTEWDIRQVTDLTGYGFNDVTNRQVLDSSNVGSYALTSLPSHTHDDRYYTESEVDTKLGTKAASSHTHAISNVTDLQTALDGKQASLGFTPYNATNPSGYITSYVNTVTSVGISGDLSTGNVEFRGSGATTISKSGGTITISSTDTDTNTTYSAGTGLTLTGTAFSVTAGTYAASSHTHTIGNVTGLQTALDGKQASGDYSVSSHTHAIRDITDLQTTLDGKQASGNYAASSHTHAISNITDLQTALDGKLSTSGTAANATTATFVASPDGDRVAGNKLPTSNPRSVRFDFANAGSITGATGNYAGVMTYAPWDGTSASTGDSSYQLAFTNQSGVNASGPAQLVFRNGINSTWNAWLTLLSSANYNSYSPTLTGTGASGTWGISITGNSATTSQRDFSGDISTNGMGRFTGWYTGNAQTGLAAEIGISAGQAYIIAYNRQTSSYGALNLEASGANLRISGSTINASSGTLQQGGNAVIHAGNIASQSVSYATTAGSTTGNSATATSAGQVSGISISTNEANALKTTLGVTSLPYSCDIIVDGDPNTYYPVHFIWGDQDVWRRIIIKRGYGEQAPWDPIGTGSHHGGLLLDWEGNFGGWGGAAYSDRLRVFQESYTNICADMYISTHSMGYVFMLRGGGAVYHIFSDQTIRGYQNPSAPDIAYDTNFIFYDHSNTAYNVYAPAPVTAINSSRIDGLRTKKQSQFDDRYQQSATAINTGNIGSQSVSYANSAGAVTWDNVSSKPTIPTNTNQLTNGAGYITSYVNTVTSVGISGDLSTGDVEFRGSGATTISKSGGTITITSTDTDTNTTYSAGTGLTLTGTAFSVTAGTYAAASHTHTIGNVTGLQTALDGKQASLGFTPYNATNPSGFITSGDTTTGIFTTFLGDGTSNIGSGYTRVIRNENGLGGNPNYAPILHIAASDTMWQIAAGHAGQTNLVWRSGYSGAWDTPWWTILHTGNYTSFAPSLTGTGASGTWGISITGNANTASAVAWDNVSSKPTTFAPSSHTHTIGNVTGLQTALDGKQASGDYSVSGHTHAIRDITDLQTTLDGKQASLGFTPYNATNPSGFITGLSFANVSSKPTTLSGYGITDSVKSNGTLSGNIDSDWGESFTTFDPIPSGTPPLQSPNIRTVNIGANYDRRTQLAFDYASDLFYFRRRSDSGWGSWREVIHSGNIGSFALTSYTETDTLGTVTNRGNSTSQNIVFSNGRKGLVGVYDAAQTQAIFAMGPAYVLTDGGASNTYGDLYGLAWSYNPGYGGAGNNPQSISGLNHQLLLMQAGRTTAALGSGIWTSGNIAANNFSGTSSGTNTGDQTNISGNAATATNVAYSGLTGTVPTWNQDTTGNASKLNPLSGDSNYKLAYTADGARNNAGEWGRAVMFYVPNGQTYGIRVDRADVADSATTAANSNYVNSTRDTPSNALQYWQTSGLGLDEAPSTDWHNTIRMGHGSPLSYYSNTLAVRMTGTGVGDIYTQTIMNGVRQGWKKHWNDSNLTNLNQLSNGPGYITSYVNTVTSVGISGDLSTGDIDFRAGGATTISKSGGTITITSTDTDTNTTYSAGTGLTLSGTTFSVTSGTYAAASHTHTIGNVTGLQTALDGKQASLGFTPYNATNPSGFITSTSNISGNAATATNVAYSGLTGTVPTWNQNTTGNAATATTAPNASNLNTSYGVTAGAGYGLKFWGGSDTYKISMGNDAEYHYGPVTDYSIKTVIDSVGATRGFTWGVNGGTPIAALNVGNGNMQIAGSMAGTQFRFTNSGNNAYITGDAGWGAKIVTDSGYILFGPANGSWAHIYSDKRFYFNQDLYVNGEQVLHSGNYSSYALPLSGGTVTGIAYFQTNNGAKSGATDSAKLQAYSTGNNAAFMSFHKSGNYAVNFGLDDDNVMRLGGWSAAANRMQLDMSGNVTFAGNVTGYSDARIKTDIKTIGNALEKVKQLRGVSFTRTDSDDRSTNIGVIAQEVLAVVPEVVSQDASGMYNVAYGNMAGLFIEAIKQQQTLIEQQQKQIDQLKALVDGLTK